MILTDCYLPFDVSQQVLDITEKSREQNKEHESSLTNEQLCIIFAICHAIGMLSACANPIIYGFLNENFHREFIDIFNRIRKAIEFVVCYCQKVNTSTGNNNNAAITLNNGDISNANHRHQVTSLAMKCDPFSCCKKKQETNTCYDDVAGVDGNGNHSMPLRQLNNNQQSVSGHGVALHTNPVTKCNGIRKIDEESCQFLPQKNQIEHGEDSMPVTNHNTLTAASSADCKNTYVVQKPGETVELISDKNHHKISVLITPSPPINDV